MLKMSCCRGFLLYLDGYLEKPRLAYWLREGGKNNAEVDFVVAHEGEILPIEVKAGAAGALKSLRELIFAKHLSRALRFDLNRPSSQTVSLATGGEAMAYRLDSLPLYAVPHMNDFLVRTSIR